MMIHFALTKETERERTEWLGLFGCQKWGGLDICRPIVHFVECTWP